MNRKQYRKEMNDRHNARMADSAEVEVVRGRRDGWQVRCYDHHGFYIGGMSSSTLESASAEAHKYAVSAHLSIPANRALKRAGVTWDELNDPWGELK